MGAGRAGCMPGVPATADQLNREESSLRHRLTKMHCWASLLAVLGLIFAHGPAAAQTSALARISSPGDGEVLRGTVIVRGTANSPAFLGAELAFAYADTPEQTWFLIADISQPVVDGELAVWDTSAVSDGGYTVRLRLVSADGSRQEAALRVEVRNYTSAVVASSTPAQAPSPAIFIETPIILMPSPTALLTNPSTPTPLPSNPAALTPAAILGGFSRGGLAVVATFLLVAVLLLRRRA